MLGRIFIGCLLLLIPLEAEPDHKVGDAQFKIWVQGQDVLLEPLVAPTFKLAVLKGTKIEPNTITKCSIWARQVGVNEQERVVMTATILKCGDNEYGIAEVDFATIEGR